MRLNSVGRFTIYCMAACLIAALLMTFAKAGLLDEQKCKNPAHPNNLTEAVQATDDRLIACFNYQQELSKRRDADYQLKMLEFERRLLDLEKRK